MKKKVMVFAVHPDDETLGAGGSILKHIAEGDEVHWVIMTTMSESNGFTKQRILERNKEIEAVAEAYGLSKIHRMPFDTTKLDTLPVGDLVQAVSQLVSSVQPEIVYIPYAHDVHSDHKVAAEVLMSLSKTFRYPSVKKILAMEVLSETNFGHIDGRTIFWGNYYVNISAYMAKKLEILNIFHTELKPHPFARSLKNIESQGILRGSEINVEHAEAFHLVRMIES
jgi:LmbE family N-acetylglucosaminyl deacetylase